MDRRDYFNTFGNEWPYGTRVDEANEKIHVPLENEEGEEVVRVHDYDVVLNEGDIIFPTVQYCLRTGPGVGQLLRVTNQYETVTIYDEDRYEEVVTRKWLCVVLMDPDSGGGGYWLTKYDVYDDFSLNDPWVSGLAFYTKISEVPSPRFN